MTVYDPHRSTGFAVLLGYRVGSAVMALVDTLRAWNGARVTRNALSRLSDRELDDIGLTRGEIENLSKRTR